MVVDTSALAAILCGEPERGLFEDLILSAPAAATSTAVLVELDVVVRRRFASYPAELLDEFLTVLGLELVPFDGEQARHARAALAAFGRGRHPAGLTFGDCLVVGLARQRNAPVLFKGDGFALTDVSPAWLPAERSA